MHIKESSTSSINLVNQNTGNNVQKINDDVSIFSNEKVNEPDYTDELISRLIDGVLDEIFSDGSFTTNEAKTYVEGEKELAEIIKKEKSKQGFFESLFDMGSLEKKCRDDYAKSHPEYSKVMKEGQKVQKQYEDAMKLAKKEWIKENPQPENIYEEGGLLGFKRTEEYATWQKELTNFLNDFEKEYIKNNNDYRTLRTEQNKDKDAFEELAQDFISILVDEII